MNKSLEEIAHEYELDFRDEVYKAENDPNVIMVPVDEPSRHFMAGWYAAIEHIRVTQALKELSSSRTNKEIYYTVGTSSGTNVHYDPVLGWVTWVRK